MSGVAFTPQLIWRDEWRGHPNGVTDIAGFVFRSSAPAATAALYARIFGAGVLENEAGNKPENGRTGGGVFPAGRARIRFLRPERADPADGRPPWTRQRPVEPGSAPSVQTTNGWTGPSICRSAYRRNSDQYPPSIQNPAVFSI